MTLHGVDFPMDRIATFCRAHGVARLSLFGSILTEAFTPTSDVDVLVEFLPGRTPGLIAISGMELELAAIVNRTVDLRTPQDLSKYFRHEVVAGARLLHAA